MLQQSESQKEIDGMLKQGEGGEFNKGTIYNSLWDYFRETSKGCYSASGLGTVGSLSHPQTYSNSGGGTQKNPERKGLQNQNHNPRFTPGTKQGENLGINTPPSLSCLLRFLSMPPIHQATPEGGSPGCSLIQLVNVITQDTEVHRKWESRLGVENTQHTQHVTHPFLSSEQTCYSCQQFTGREA